MPGIAIETNNQELREAYANHLMQFDWNSMLTQTFKRTRHDGTNAVNAVWIRLQPFGYTRAFFAVEPHKLDGIHLHALLRKNYESCIDDTRVKQYCDKTFGWSVISPIRNNATVSLYCAKYVVKGNDYFYEGAPIAWQLW